MDAAQPAAARPPEQRAQRHAASAGVSPSTLFAGFRNRHGITPMGYVRQLRLQHVRDELLADDTPGLASVTDVALKWGARTSGASRSSTRARSANRRR
ncbi:helix-turn-helix domain-containing protein [Burkholderia metallica]|nr:helix-turn-helix domain-containing protein [Burkholderia metallica]